MICGIYIKVETQNKVQTPAPNERFGATAAGSAYLKGSAEMPPLRQAAIPLYASRRHECSENDRETTKYYLETK